MIYQLKKNNSKSLRFLYGVLFVLFLLFVLSYTRLDSYLSGVLETVTRPLFVAEGSIDGSAVQSLFISKTDLVAENKKLKSLLLEKDALLLNKIEIEKENTRLKEMLGRDNQEKLLLGHVLQKPNHSPYDTLLIDIGSRNGLFTGKLVLAYGAIPIGEVVEVYEKTSIVKMFSTPLQEVTVHIGEKNIEGVAIGIGGGNFRMLLPKDTAVEVGDSIKIPGEGNRILGIVEKIEKGEAETFARIYFKSPANIYELEEVFVVIE